MVAAVSLLHSHDQGIGLPRAHGPDALARSVSAGDVTMTTASLPEKPGYVRNAWGFWPPYAASEVTLGILARSRIPEPGQSCGQAAVREGPRGLLDLAHQPVVRTGDLADRGHLCVCAGAYSADGQWLGRLLSADDLLARNRTAQDTVTGSGAPAAAELYLREATDVPLPVRELGVLAVSARRTAELTETVRRAFLGNQRGAELGPEWMAQRLTGAGSSPLRYFGRDLALDMVARSQRVARAKARRRSSGALWLPSRLQERGRYLFRQGWQRGEAIGTVEEMDLVGAWATSETGPWAMLIWCRPDLIVIDASRSDRPLWRYHQPSAALTPRVLADQRSLERAPLVSHGPQLLPFQKARDLLVLLGLPAPEPPLTCR